MANDATPVSSSLNDGATGGVNLSSKGAVAPFFLVLACICAVGTWGAFVWWRRLLRARAKAELRRRVVRKFRGPRRSREERDALTFEREDSEFFSL